MRFLILSALFAFLPIAAIAQSAYTQGFETLKQKGWPVFMHQEVDAEISRWVENKNSGLMQTMGQAKAYLAIVEPLLKINGVPAYLSYIPLANTGYNVQFVSSEGASGAWPLDILMARKYGLKMNSYVDERRNIYLSSQAAGSYLWDLHQIYKDWLKAITAFYIGPLRLNQIIHSSGGELGFSELFEKMMPEERLPIVKYMAAMYCMNYAKELGMEPVELFLEETDTAYVEEFFSFQVISEITGLSETQIGKYNPELIAKTVPYWGKPYPFQLPSALVPDFNKKKDSVIRSWQEARAPKVLYDTIVRVVDSVTYIEVKPREVSAGSTNNTSPQAQPPENTSNAKIWVYYKVKPGDGFYTLADIFDCTIAELKAWNGIRNNNLYAGVTLKFYVLKSKTTYYQGMNYLTATQKRNIALKD